MFWFCVWHRVCFWFSCWCLCWGTGFVVGLVAGFWSSGGDCFPRGLVMAFGFNVDSGVLLFAIFFISVGLLVVCISSFL